MTRTASICLLLALSSSLATAVEPPAPAHYSTKQKHEWLRENLAADMWTLGTFPYGGYKEMVNLVTQANPKETDSLVNYYALSRKIADRELRQARAAWTPSFSAVSSIRWAPR